MGEASFPDDPNFTPQSFNDLFDNHLSDPKALRVTNIQKGDHLSTPIKSANLFGISAIPVGGTDPREVNFIIHEGTPAARLVDAFPGDPDTGLRAALAAYGDSLEGKLEQNWGHLLNRPDTNQ